MIGNLKEKLAKTRETFKDKFDEFLKSDKDKEEILDNLFESLILADVSLRSSEKILHSLREKTKKTDPSSKIKELLEQEIIAILSRYPSELQLENSQSVVMFVGVNGGGKTTLVKHIVAQLSDKTDTPWWIFDVKGSEYAGLARQKEREITVLRPGLDTSFVISLMDSNAEGDEGYAYSTFVMLRELLKERGDSSELSPAMERLLRESVIELSKSLDENHSVQSLSDMISTLASNDRTGTMTRDALLNRLQILFQEPLSDILRGGSDAIDISSLLDKRIILDLSYVARVGGMDSARILYNLIAKRIFEGAMKRGIVPGLHHVVVLEEANNLVPESYSKHSSADVTTGESMVLLQRATGQGVIVVSTRPNISSNILANTATKIVFRLPYDSQVGGRFLSLNLEQETYLRSIKCGRALVSIPNTETFEVATSECK